ncbi:MAG: LOG family protein, partial [uncultured Nocardioidaceae bacterium]
EGPVQGTRHDAAQPGRGRLDDRPAAARLARSGRLGAHRPVAGAAHPVRVRRGLRCAGRAGSGHRGLRLGADHRRPPRVRARRAGRSPPGRGGLRRHHRRRARRHGGGQQGGERGGRCQRGAGDRAALRGRAEPVGRQGHQLPLLLRPQDHVREVQPRLRGAAGRARHLRRALRGADARADPEGDLVPGGAARQRLLAGPGRLAAHHRPRGGEDQRPGPRHVHRHRRRRPGRGAHGQGPSGPHRDARGRAAGV